MANTAPLQAAVEKADLRLTEMRTVVDGAVVLIGSIKDTVTKAVTDALTADNSADDASITAAVTAIDESFAGFEAEAKKLSDAMLANTPNQPPV